MTKEQFKQKLIDSGWQEDAWHPNKLTAGSALRCALHKKSYRIEKYSPKYDLWIPEKINLYRKEK